LFVVLNYYKSHGRHEKLFLCSFPCTLDKSAVIPLSGLS
jgi:hypothetical protein